MHPFDPVLAVVDPTSTAQPAAHKAARLAAATGSGLHLLVCDYEAAFDDDPLYRSDVAEAAALCADLHLVHACSDSALLAAATSGARPLQEGIDTAELIRIERRRLEHGLAALADAHGVHATRITVQEGSPPAVILALAHQCRPTSW